MEKPTIQDVLTAVSSFAAHVEKRFVDVEKRFVDVELRFDGVSRRFEKLEEKFDSRFDALTADVRGLRYDLLGEHDEQMKLKRRVEFLEERTLGSTQQ